MALIVSQSCCSIYRLENVVDRLEVVSDYCDRNRRNMALLQATRIRHRDHIKVLCVFAAASEGYRCARTQTEHDLILKINGFCYVNFIRGAHSLTDKSGESVLRSVTNLRLLLESQFQTFFRTDINVLFSDQNCIDQAA